MLERPLPDAVGDRSVGGLQVDGSHDPSHWRCTQLLTKVQCILDGHLERDVARTAVYGVWVSQENRGNIIHLAG